MQTKHAKSPCCRAKIRRFGSRRRQCSRCHRTWRIRRKRRGRAPWRAPSKLIERVLLRGFTVRHLSQRYARIGEHAFRYRFRHALQRFVEKPRPSPLPSEGPLILIADGLWFSFRDHPWVLYLMAIKPCGGHRAFFLEPVLLPGLENAASWVRVFDTIPGPIASRIRAVVVDNLHGMKTVIHHRHWIVQLCHFHLLAKLRRGQSRRKHSLVGGPIRRHLYDLIDETLKTPNPHQVEHLLEELRGLARQACGTIRIQGMIREFIRSIRCYRAYRDYPDLHLPTTTNSLECTGSLIRTILRRCRAASTPQALLLWTRAFLKFKNSIVCNGI